ncbi:MAG: nuclear transport factor 2 family protein [Woeseiaceae bacterium]
MMRSAITLVAASLVLVVQQVWGEQGGGAAGEDEVLQVQASRFQAMTEANIEALRVILADELTYTHTTGSVDTKAEFLDALQSQGINYHSIEPTDAQVRIYDNTAVITGVSAMKVSAGENHYAFSIRFIEVYRKNDGNWQLVAWQSTRLPDK